MLCELIVSSSHKITNIAKSLPLRWFALLSEIDFSALLSMADTPQPHSILFVAGAAQIHVSGWSLVARHLQHPLLLDGQQLLALDLQPLPTWYRGIFRTGRPPLLTSNIQVT